jgi:predicted GIY-YIG superfamily endonuclease
MGPIGPLFDFCFRSQRELFVRMPMADWWIYLIEKRGKLYVGITTDLENRMRQHGTMAPLYQEGPFSKDDAVRRERILKGWTRKKKLELITNASSQRK